MANDRVVCPYCSYRMPIEITPGAIARGLLVRCKGRKCGKIFEIKVLLTNTEISK